MAWCDDGTDQPKMAHVHFAKAAPGEIFLLLLLLYIFFYWIVSSFHNFAMGMHLHQVLNAL